MSVYLVYNGNVKRRYEMFEKIINAFIVKTTKKSGMTVISEKREISLGGSIKSSIKPELKPQSFWENRGRYYAALFTSINGRTF